MTGQSAQLRLQASCFLLILIVCILPGYKAWAQKVFLVHGRKKIPFPNPVINPQWIGITTATDTIRYNSNGDFSYSLYNAGIDSFVIRRPVKHHDVVMPADDYYKHRPSFEIVSAKWYKENKKPYIRLTASDEDEYRTFAYKDINSLRYPTYTGNGDGCEGCILIPGLNVWYLIWAANRWKPHIIDLKEWKFMVR